MPAVTVKNIEDVAPYAGPHAIAGIRFRAVRQALGVTSWGMNVIELDPNCTNHPEHDHAKEGHEEVYVVLQGGATLHVDGTTEPLRAGDLAYVPPAARRQLVTGEEGAVILALGGTPGEPYAPAMGS